MADSLGAKLMVDSPRWRGVTALEKVGSCVLILYNLKQKVFQPLIARSLTFLIYNYVHDQIF